MATEQRTVVVVEDELDTAEMFAEMVRLMGFDVIKTYGGVRAIDIIAEQKPAVVVLDIMMPDLSGIEVLRYIHRDPRLAGIPVIIVSAKGMPSDIKSGLEAGASFYLTKPVSFMDLREAIGRATRSTGQSDA